MTESTYGRAKSGALIFSEEFNSLNLDLWKHDITMSGGGVRVFFCKFCDLMKTSKPTECWSQISE